MGDDLDEWPAHGPIVGGVGSNGHPWDWDDETAQALADELEEKLARRRPPGFAPWPESIAQRRGSAKK